MPQTALDAPSIASESKDPRIRTMARQLAALDRSMATISFDPDGTIRTANANFLDAMGYGLDEVVGQHHRIFVTAAFAASEKYRTFWQRLRSGEFFSAEFQRVAKDGSDVWIQATYNPILDDDGNVVEVVKYATDVTETVRVRRAIAQVGVDLRGASAQLTGIASDLADKSLLSVDKAARASETGDRVDASIQTVASAIEEMLASINSIAENTSHAADVTREAVGLAEATNQTVSSLGQSSAEIGEVLKVITSIAQQTNLLALNATIEAARAGDAGRGFAVVANEVKELAKETARATEDIRNRIDTIQSDTERAVQAIDEVSGVIDQISEITTTIAGAVEEQSITSTEISRNVSLAADGTGQMAQTIRDLSGAAQEGRTASTTLLQAAQGLEQRSQDLAELVEAS